MITAMVLGVLLSLLSEGRLPTWQELLMGTALVGALSVADPQQRRA